MNKDARVADARVCHRMGWKFYKGELAFGKVVFAAYPKTHESRFFTQASFEEFANTPHKQISTATIPPFISAPTFATDGIVLEWVQGNIELHSPEWDTYYREFIKILRNREMLGGITAHMNSYLILARYKPGDYAQALLRGER